MNRAHTNSPPQCGSLWGAQKKNQTRPPKAFGEAPESPSSPRALPAAPAQRRRRLCRPGRREQARSRSRAREEALHPKLQHGAETGWPLKRRETTLQDLCAGKKGTFLRLSVNPPTCIWAVSAMFQAHGRYVHIVLKRFESGTHAHNTYSIGMSQLQSWPLGLWVLSSTLGCLSRRLSRA